QALKTGVNRQVTVASTNLRLVIRNIVWMGSTFLGVVGFGFAAHYSRLYLHVVSARWTCESGYPLQACRAEAGEFACVNRLWEFGLCAAKGLGIGQIQGLEFPFLGMALGAATLAALASMYAISLLAKKQVIGSVPVFIGQLGFAVVVVLPFFSV